MRAKQAEQRGEKQNSIRKGLARRKDNALLGHHSRALMRSLIKTRKNSRCLLFLQSAFFPISFPNLGKRKISHIKQKPYIVFDLLNIIQYMVSVAGVAGFVRNGIAIVRQRRNRVSNK